MNRKNFLLLMSLSKDNAAVGQAVLDRVKRQVDPGAKPAWIDSKGCGLFISTDLRAAELWRKSLPDRLTSEQTESIRDMLLLELGPDCLGWPESKAMAWLNSHRTSTG